MRIFASDVIKRVMGTFGIPEDEPIYNSMITRSLEKAQTKIEELHFDNRKHVLAYDDVLNVQRTSVYGRRRALLVGGVAAVDQELTRIGEGRPDYAEKVEGKKNELGNAFYPQVRRFLLQTIDHLWVENLEAMEYLRSSVNLRAYGQRDPLVEYKKEGLRLFQQLEETYKTHVADSLPRLLGSAPAESVKQARQTPWVTRAAPAEKYSRNDRVVITNGTEQREMKFKKAEGLLATGEWRIAG